MNKEFDIILILQKVLKKKIQILLFAFLSFILVFVYFDKQPPKYESRGLLKIGKFYVLNAFNNFDLKLIDNSIELSKQLEFVLAGKSLTKSDAQITKFIPVEKSDVFIEIHSISSNQEYSTQEILLAEKYIQNLHNEKIFNFKKRYISERNSLDSRLKAISEKQKGYLLDKKRTDPYESILNAINILTLVNTDLGISQINNLVERRNNLEFLINNNYEDTQLVGRIEELGNTNKSRSKKYLILSVFLSLIFSVLYYFIKEISFLKNDKE